MRCPRKWAIVLVAMPMNISVRRAGPYIMHLTESVFEVISVTNRGRMEHVRELTLIVMEAEVKHFCWDWLVGQKVTVEGPGQACEGEVGQPI